MIELDQQYLDEIKKVFIDQIPEYEVLVYGSRVKGNATPFSDLDIAVKGDRPLDANRLSHLVETFADSDLPIKVDIVDRATVSEPFRKIIDTHNEVLVKKSPR
jgi:uncharacterized protein